MTGKSTARTDSPSNGSHAGVTPPKARPNSAQSQGGGLAGVKALKKQANAPAAAGYSSARPQQVEPLRGGGSSALDSPGSSDGGKGGDSGKGVGAAKLKKGASGKSVSSKRPASPRAKSPSAPAETSLRGRSRKAGSRDGSPLRDVVGWVGGIFRKANPSSEPTSPGAQSVSAQYADDGGQEQAAMSDSSESSSLLNTRLQESMSRRSKSRRGGASPRERDPSTDRGSFSFKGGEREPLSKSFSGLSESSFETEDEERMRAFTTLESAEESDFVNASQDGYKVVEAAAGAGGMSVSERTSSRDASSRRSARRASLRPEELAAVSEDPSPQTVRRCSKGLIDAEGKVIAGDAPAAGPRGKAKAKEREAEHTGSPGRPRSPSQRRPSIRKGDKQRSSRSPSPPPHIGSKLSEWAAEAWKAPLAFGVDKQSAAESTMAYETENAEWFQLMRHAQPDKSYTGPKPHVLVTRADMQAMLQAFRNGEKLHERFVLQLMIGIKRQWTWHAPKFNGQRAQTVLDLPEPAEGTKLVIVGDTHGQLQDVLWIFTEYGPPSEKNIYLFNGDVADRGTNAVEIFMLIFGYMQLYPGSVFLSRGNHENEEINERALKFGGGFAEEVRSKYGAPVFDFFTELFELLPLAFVIAKKALVLHGGLWRHRGVSLSQLRKLDSRRQCPEAPQSYDEYLFFDILWSDPHPNDADGVHESTRGDGCVLFGKDITAEFLRRNSLQMLIRSHQLPSDGHGYEVLHDGRCITVFSASNYGGSCYNAGAVLIWENGEIDAHEFISPGFEKLRAATEKGEKAVAELISRYSSRGEQWEEEVGCAAEPSHVARLDGEIVRMLKERICRSKPALYSALAQADVVESGVIDEATWCKVLTQVLKVDINFAKYRPFLIDLTEDGMVDYNAFLHRYQVRLREQYAGWQHTVLQMFYNSLLAADLEISELISFLDPDGDGRVSLSECVDALNSLKLGLSYGQIRQLVSTLGFDKARDVGGNSPGKSKSSSRANSFVRPEEKPGDAMVDVELYLKRLTLVADTVRPKSEQEKHDLVTIAAWIRQISVSSKRPLAEVFKEWDADGDGYIDYNEFVSCCVEFQNSLDQSTLDYVYTVADLEQIAKVIDTAKSGRINYLAFLSLFRMLEEEGQGCSASHALHANRAVIEHICSTIWANEVLLSKAFRLFDPKQLGLLSPADFRSALASLNDVLATSDNEQPITRQQLDVLVQALPLDSKGKVNYKDFMQSFEVVDTAHEV
ncbi:hypothetical protein AB1Y20_004041 [Prymnesium parvum]|uniref:EF-hand domain-containing protein n=1 Tax=Prymnesium parvum TaxID=97485 RepID=A0AB34J922_PRYPA|mmetsp:Transcript_14909/g.35465  ORF Transcript_14909/g.35465 Transcript_14909/m.35465 type:complete len:1245 (+) Transcript_14909:221-3955(+)